MRNSYGMERCLGTTCLTDYPSDMTGEIDVAMMKKNMNEAIKVYIERVNNTPSMGTTIKLYPGVEQSSFHNRRNDLLIFLKGTQEKKAALKKEKPALFAHFEKVWMLRDSHMVSSSIPSKYAFVLKCCGSSDCIHPACTGKPIDVKWFDNGPSIGTIMPTPVVESKSGVNEICGKCSKKECAGHYQSSIPNLNDLHALVPSEFISDEVIANPSFDMERIHRVAEKCILPPSTVQFYVNHLLQVQKNRKRGVEKAKKTRLAKMANATESKS